MNAIISPLCILPKLHRLAAEPTMSSSVPFMIGAS